MRKLVQGWSWFSWKNLTRGIFSSPETFCTRCGIRLSCIVCYIVSKVIRSDRVTKYTLVNSIYKNEITWTLIPQSAQINHFIILLCHRLKNILIKNWKYNCKILVHLGYWREIGCQKCIHLELPWSNETTYSVALQNVCIQLILSQNKLSFKKVKKTIF